MFVSGNLKPIRQTPVKTILEPFTPAFGVFPKTGDAESVVEANLVVSD